MMNAPNERGISYGRLTPSPDLLTINNSQGPIVVVKENGNVFIHQEGELPEAARLFYTALFDGFGHSRLGQAVTLLQRALDDGILLSELDKDIREFLTGGTNVQPG